MRIIIGILLLLSIGLKLSAKGDISYVVNQAFLDSLETRIAYLNKRIPELKKARDPKYLINQQQLEKTQFVFDFESYVIEEELQKAKEMVLDHMVHTELSRDKNGSAFYQLYKDRINNLIKDQKVYYQQLFAKEKNFQKAMNKILKEDNIEAYKKARQKTLLAIKYANETNLRETSKFLENYLQLINALILDNETIYDLDKLTKKEKYFFENFTPLVKSDSLQLIKQADTLLLLAKRYASMIHTRIDTNFFAKQQQLIITAISDYHYRKGNSLDEIKDKIAHGELTKLNQKGVYKWNEFIVVIDEFNVTSKFENVNRGEAILNADKKLFEYLRVNELAKLDKGLKVGHAFIIPFVNNDGKKDFLLNPATNKLQYIVCYTEVENKKFTQQVSQYMQPISFESNPNLEDISENIQ